MSSNEWGLDDAAWSTGTPGPSPSSTPRLPRHADGPKRGRNAFRALLAVAALAVAAVIATASTSLPDAVGLVLPAYRQYLKHRQTQEAVAELGRIRDLQSAYRADPTLGNGEYASTLGQLRRAGGSIRSIGPYFMYTTDETSAVAIARPDSAFLVSHFKVKLVYAQAEGQTDRLVLWNDANVPIDELRGACDAGDATACHELGDAYLSAHGVLQDERRGAALMHKACDLGSAVGCDGLGAAYQFGLGVGRDEDHALEIYLRACEMGSACACNDRAYTLATRSESLDEAVRLARKADAALPDNVHFLDTLGWVYFKQARYTLAIETLERAQALEPGNRTVRGHLDAVRREMSRQAR